MTNIIILPSSLFQQFGQWSDTRSWKTRSMSVPLSLKLLQTNSFAFFVFLVPVFEALLHSKVALLVFVFGRMWWKLFTFTRGSHTFTLTRGEISSECVTKGVIGRTSAEYDEESEISIKWIWNSWSSRLCSLRYSVFSFIFPCIHRQFGLECSAKKIFVWFGSGPFLVRGMEGLVGPWRLQICHIRKSPQLAPASGPPPSPHPSTLYYMSATK